ncbi:MAG: hypothetical protein MRZ98_09325 [Clostridiales bacterium]|nr:hypothetical protein [Clostridiales bacterium]
MPKTFLQSFVRKDRRQTSFFDGLNGDASVRPLVKRLCTYGGQPAVTAWIKLKFAAMNLKKAGNPQVDTLALLFASLTGGLFALGDKRRFFALLFC